MSPSPNEVIRRLYKEFWNERNLEVADQLVSETHALTSPHIFGSMVGPEIYKRQLALFVMGFPDLQFTVEQTVCEDDKIAVYWTIRGTHLGDFLGLPPTNRPVSITGITIHQIVDGKILDSQALWDAITLFQQLGVTQPFEIETRAASTS
jgi:steroid delta-isomerase-like uncharacterized protein